MKKYVIALDQGTTSSRAIAFNVNGNPVASKNVEFKQIFPKPGWVEHDPDDIYDSQMEALRLMMKEAGIKADEIDSIGITNQRETVMAWNSKTGIPVHNAIVWQCRRTAPICEELRQKGYAELIKSKTGLVPDAYFSGTKIKWLLDNIPEAANMANNGNLMVGTVDTWLMYRMSKGRIHATDASNASRTMLYDITKGCWDKDLCGILGIPMGILPEVVDSSGVVFNFELDGASIPVAGLAGDQQAALFGQTCYKKGESKNTYGTGCFILMNTGEKPVFSAQGLLTTIAWRINGKTEYALEGSVFNAGSVIQWLRDSVGLLDDAAKSEEMARSVKDTGGVYFVPAFTGLGTPYWDMYARGNISGITRGTTKEHIVRAGLESIAYRSAEVLEIMAGETGIKPYRLYVDGGASANDFLMEFQAALIECDIIRPVVRETTALGAAFLAGLATGFWNSKKALDELVETDRVFSHSKADKERISRMEGWRKAVARAKGTPDVG
ncbi:MAG: glycerol kinase GlpK [Clostridia bacterium]|nr:glycerol kinase GlpK [Clostridia bacterium]